MHTITIGHMHVITIDQHGVAEAMHNDKFPLSFLGDQKIQRASEISFNETTQDWEISLMVSHPVLGRTPERVVGAGGFATYDGARTVEVEWLNLCRRNGVDPLSHHGGMILLAVRGGLSL